MQLPQLTTARLRLRPATSDDLTTLQQLWNRPEVRLFLFDDCEVDEGLARQVLDDAFAAADDCGLWLAWRAHDRSFVGCTALLPATVAASFEPRLAGQLEPMAAIVPELWSQGFGTECIDAMVGHALERLGRECLVAVHDVPNIGSGRMLRKVGFVPLSEVPGPKYPMLTYTLTLEQWQRPGGK